MTLHLFEAFGIELEYMIVDRDTLEVQPIADELLKSMTGSYSGDFENGMVTWSNELVLHLIELKCTKPESDLAALEQSFHQNIKLPWTWVGESPKHPSQPSFQRR